MTDHIQNYWEKQGDLYSQSHKASWEDRYGIELEIEEIGKFINPGDRVLDIGCANGFSTFRQLKNDPKQLIGIDFAESMIQAANRSSKECGFPANIEFQIGDVCSLDFDSDLFDVTYTTRVLINLPTWADQKVGIQEALRVTKKGGHTILSEAFYEPLVLLNAIRALLNLPPLIEHDFNRYLKQIRLEEFLRRQGIEFYRIDLSSLYYFGSRVFRELIFEAVKDDGYTNPINKVFFELQKQYSSDVGLGIQQMYVLRK